MNTKISSLMMKSLSNNLDEEMFALTDIGLLLERHTQNRYSQEEYLALLGNDIELYEYRLDDFEAEMLVNFIFYYILNTQRHQVTAAWCLGKCYGFEIFRGLMNLFKVFKDNDDVCQQLIFSMTSLFKNENMYHDIYNILEASIKSGNLPKSADTLSDRIYD